MRLKTLSIESFRCFRRLDITLDPSLTVVIADNGKGKTAILEAIACLLGQFPSCLGIKGMPGLQDCDFHDEWELDGTGVLRKKIREPFMKIAGLVDVSGYDNWRSSVQTLAWEVSRMRDASRKTSARKTAFSYDKSLLREFADSFVNQQNEGTPVVYPILALYGTERAIGRMPVVPGSYTNKEYTVCEAYKVSLQGQLNYRKLIDWLLTVKHHEQGEIIKRKDFDFRSIASQTIEKVIEKTLPGFKNLQVFENPTRLTVDRVEGEVTNRYLVDMQLSDGFKIVLTMVLDLVSRILVLNGGRDGVTVDALLGTPGIVLIDEVDLHLHPSWQQRIVQDIRRTFPNIQFILTTHSPQVVSSVPACSVRLLNEVGQVESVEKSEGVASSQVLKTVFRTSPYPRQNELRRKLDRFLRLAYAEHWERAETLALGEELRQHFEGVDEDFDSAQLHLENERWERDHAST